MLEASGSPVSPAQARAAIATVKRWYHSIEVAPGVVTPGWFDLRSSVQRLPWPEVRGRRCLDVGTSDGFFAFELERRGAGEVVATDIGRHEDWDWELGVRSGGVRYMEAIVGPEPGRGFEVARALLHSRVRREQVSVYDLDPGQLGKFDVIVCGSLLLHLRDPLRALEAIRGVCGGLLLHTNQVDLGRSICSRRPLFRLDGTSGITQWWLPNREGNRQLLRAAGFAIERESGLYAVRFGPSHPRPARRPRALLAGLARRMLAGAPGVPHHAILARPQSTSER